MCAEGRKGDQRSSSVGGAAAAVRNGLCLHRFRVGRTFIEKLFSARVHQLPPSVGTLHNFIPSLTYTGKGESFFLRNLRVLSKENFMNFCRHHSEGFSWDIPREPPGILNHHSPNRITRPYMAPVAALAERPAAAGRNPSAPQGHGRS